MVSRGLRALHALAFLCTGSDAKAPEEMITVQSKQGESMNGVILTTASLEKAKAELEHTIDALQTKAMEDVKAKAAAVSKRTEKTLARWEAAKEVASRRLAERAQLVELRWRRISVSSFHNRLGKCCCRHIDPGAPATPDCHWEAYDRGGPYVDFACHDGYKDYLEALPAEEMAGERRFLASSADALLDQCFDSEGWSLLAEPSAKRSTALAVEVTEVEVSTTAQGAAGRHGGNFKLTDTLPLLQPQLPPSRPKEEDRTLPSDLWPAEALAVLPQNGTLGIPSAVQTAKMAPAQEDRTLTSDLWPPTALAGLPQNRTMGIPIAGQTAKMAPAQEDAQEVNLVISDASPVIKSLLASGPVENMLQQGELWPPESAVPKEFDHE